MNDAVIENHQKYAERLEIFKTHGYDLEHERDVVLEQAQPINGSILEIGTGKGHFAIALAKQGYHFTTVDHSAEEQQCAKMNVEYFQLQDHVDFQVFDAGHLKFEDQSFDTIFAINVLHHLESPYDVIDEMARILRKSGKIIVSDFNKKGMDLVNEIHRNEGRVHPQAGVSVDQAGEYLKKDVFRIEKHRTVFQETIVAYRKKADPE